ncbi:MAG: cobalamin biosynthesis protein CobD, partial [Alphaproteobacteria bacterium]
MSGEAATLLLAPQNLAIAATALLIDRLFGYPKGLFDMVRHPVSWIGSVIHVLEARLNQARYGARMRRAAGCAMLAIVIALVLLVTIPLALALRQLPWGWAGEALVASFLLSQHGLEEAVRKVRDALETALPQAREAVSHIVGRDSATLDRSGVARGAIESLAENSSDGVVAPLLWLAVAGLPGIAFYKAVNTADSMVGYRTPRHEDFGWAAARLDDLVNLPAARLTAVLFALAALLPGTGDAQAAVASALRDAPRHKSPNAGWPEAAMAG